MLLKPLVGCKAIFRQQPPVADMRAGSGFLLIQKALRQPMSMPTVIPTGLKANCKEGMATVFTKDESIARSISFAIIRSPLLPPPPQFNLLDIGCGEGHLTAQLKKQCPTIQTVYGIDMSLTACVKGKRLYPELEFIVGDAYSLPFQDKSFDIVLLNNIWEHVPDPCRMLSAAAPLMKDDGIVLISTPNRYRFTNIVRKALTGRCKLVSTHHVTEYSQGQVEEQLEFMGFDVVEVASSPSGGSRYPVKFCSRVLRTLLCCTKSKLAFESTLFYIAKKKQSV